MTHMRPSTITITTKLDTKFYDNHAVSVVSDSGDSDYVRAHMARTVNGIPLIFRGGKVDGLIKMLGDGTRVRITGIPTMCKCNGNNVLLSQTFFDKSFQPKSTGYDRVEALEIDDIEILG